MLVLPCENVSHPHVVLPSPSDKGTNCLHSIVYARWQSGVGNVQVRATFQIFLHQIFLEADEAEVFANVCDCDCLAL